MLSTSCGNSTATHAIIKTTDDISMQNQQDLLVAFDNYMTNKIEYDQAVVDFETSNSTSDETRAETANQNMQDAKQIIDRLEPLVDADRGKYDELWKNDTNFCDDNSFQRVDWRMKNNPANHWGFNVITGYEYQWSFGQGADFESVIGQYSYAELLQGETQGVLLHMNHTERREAFNFTYNHANGSSGIISTPQRTHLNLNATSKMGDVYFNNVTGHIQVKFDGQRNDTIRFSMVGDECISWGNCNPPDTMEDAEIEKDYRRWSNPNSWSTGKLPVEGEEVLIEPSWNMLYDLEDSPVFKKYSNQWKIDH